MSDRLTVDEMWVTPELAEEWLERYNVANYRPLDRKRVDRFAGLLERGEFHATGEPVQFSSYIGKPDCRLENGQHRLAGIATAGIAARMLVVQGVAPEAMLFMDTGRPRKFADYLRHLGETDYSTLSSSVRLACLLDNGLVDAHSGQEPVDFDVLMRYYRDNRAALVAAMPPGKGVWRSTGMSRTAAVVMAWKLNRVDPDDAATFLDALTNGTDLSRGDPILALRRWLYNASRVTPTPRAAMQLAVGFKAWNHARAGRTVNHLKWRAVGNAAEGFPYPV